MMERVNLIVLLGLCVLAQPGLASAQQASPSKAPGVQTQKPQAEPSEEKDIPSQVKGVPPLRAMFLNKALFTPSKFWQYEEADEDLPAEYSVEQTATVSLGGRFTPNHGANVKYLVTMLPTPAAAHAFYAKSLVKYTRPGSTPRFVKRTRRHPHLGNESSDVQDLIVGGGKAQAYCRYTITRFGRYVVLMIGSSNLRALGPRPAHGERPWMCEPVYTQVFQAAMSRWGNYKTLLARNK